jgi:phosphopentomutase
MMVYAVGKIEDIFAGCGITEAVHTDHNMDGVDKTIAAMQQRRERGMIFTNLVDFDAKFGHRNNPEGYAGSLAEFDQRLPEITAALAEDDLLVITADHGNDPTTPSTDHSREFVPILITGSTVRYGVNLGIRNSFADLAATIADVFGVEQTRHGKSFRSLLFTEG